MGNGKQYWKDALQAAKPKGGGQDNPIDIREQKKRSTIMYRKRKLDKEVKQYVSRSKIIRANEIEAIGRRHGFYIV